MKDQSPMREDDVEWSLRQLRRMRALSRELEAVFEGSREISG